ncbi:MAG: hypothetical protein JWM10_2126 [Myxococcaceae bacterium]|nr:hypothetical protein [Myxococcaceae bacterium]
MGHLVLARLRALRGFAMLVRDPREIDGVFTIADALRTPAAMQPMVDHFARDPGGRRALAERPRLALDLDALGRLPDGTLGRVFVEHLRANGLDPRDLPTLPGATPHDYVSAHLTDTHDVWHVVTGFDTDVAGELGLQAFYVAQSPSKLAVTLLAAGLLNTLAPQNFDDHPRRLEEIARGWLLGRSCAPLFGVRWDELWAVPMAEVRARLGIDRDGVQARLAPAN